MRRLPALLGALAATTLTALAAPAFAHTGAGAAHDLAHSLTQGFLHPLSGLDHVLAMVAVGLYAAQLGGRALWLLPAAFVGTMCVGGTLGYTGMPLPMVEQGIGVSVVAMGIAVAIGLRLPPLVATSLVAAFALFHGHAHGTEVPETASGIEYMAGFALATALLHGVGIAAALGLGLKFRGLVRAGGAACAAMGAGFAFGVI